ncbi:MAG: serine hydrolase, partial [Odoribacter sp.]|nr:serine hydrolase [Odoribacter sp.]
ISVAENISEAQLKELVNKLDAYNCVIIYNNKASSRPTRQFGYSPMLAKLIESLEGKRVILCHPAIPYGLEQYIDLPIDALIVSYENHTYARHYAAQGIFGGVSMTGKLPVGINSNYLAGFGINTPKTRLGYITPEMLNLSSALLYQIDSICNWAIDNGVAPGCQVLIAKNNYIIYNKAFGHHTYDKEVPNSTSDIYDLASITKMVATTPAIMKLYEDEKIDLNKPISNYYSPLKTTNKRNITFKELLTHTAGLKSSIAFFYDLIDKASLPGSLFSTTPNANNTVKLKDNLYGYPNYQFKDSLLIRTQKENYQEILPGLYMADILRDSIMKIVINSELRAKKNYLYSDLGFVMLPLIVQEITHESLDQFCKENFYNKLGAYNTDFLAIERLDMDKVVPSSIDNFYRKSEIKGYVHDPTAALLGGVAGHAGLFSTAEDLAKIMSLYLNYGTYGDEKYLDTTTVKLFTGRTNLYPKIRRGMGFDKPEPDKHKISPTSKETPLSTFGHTGFTGTAAWADPDNELIYIFLSNRTYPNEFNTKLTKYGIRSEIQTVIYETLQFSAKN